MTSEHQANVARIERLEAALAEALHIIADYCPAHDHVLLELSNTLGTPIHRTTKVPPSTALDRLIDSYIAESKSRAELQS